MKKPMSMMTNSPEVGRRLAKRCCNHDCPEEQRHRHVKLINGRASHAQVYPRALCRAVCEGVAHQKMMDAGNLVGMDTMTVAELNMFGPLKPLMNAAHYKRAVTSNDSEIRKELGIPDNEKTPDFANLPLAKLAALKYFVSPPGHYFDVFPLHLITQGALGYMQNKTNNNNFVLERFRPNIVVENNNSEIIEEFSWIDNYVQIASAKIKIEAKTVRCSVPTRQQINIPENKEVIKSIANMNDRFLGVYASVSTTGIIKTADAFKVEIKTKSDSPANYQ